MCMGAYNRIKKKGGWPLACDFMVLSALEYAYHDLSAVVYLHVSCSKWCQRHHSPLVQTAFRFRFGWWKEAITMKYQMKFREACCHDGKRNWLFRVLKCTTHTNPSPISTLIDDSTKKETKLSFFLFLAIGIEIPFCICGKYILQQFARNTIHKLEM